MSGRLKGGLALDAMRMALQNRRPPPGLICRSDRGVQDACGAYRKLRAAYGARASMCGKGRWMDNVFIERLWRSLKYECVYLRAFETGSEARAGLGKWIACHNADRPHSALGGSTPVEAHTGIKTSKLAA